jgi:tetratricopeptide (TPR) repeat protein
MFIYSCLDFELAGGTIMQRIRSMSMYPVTTLLVSVSAVALIAGCPTDSMSEPSRDPAQGPTTSLEYPSGVDVPEIQVEGRTELDIVEELIRHRTMYARLLRTLATYYTEHGYPEKATWAQSELNDLKRVKPYRYIEDSITPVATLKPEQSIPQANALFDEGVALMKRGGHGVPALYNEETMKLALSKFKELVDEYPTSDKIAEAAYWIAVIHKEYMQEKDNTIAIKWYQRAVDWDPNLQKPARFDMAAVYDFRLKDREQAVYWYQQAIEHEDFNASNVFFAKRRIRELTAAGAGEDLPEENEPSLKPAG